MGLIELSKGERYVILEGLKGLQYNFAQEVMKKLEATRCEGCNGSGLAPYVGGDDDETPCARCGGSGFKPPELAR